MLEAHSDRESTAAHQERLVDFGAEVAEPRLHRTIEQKAEDRQVEMSLTED